MVNKIIKELAVLTSYTFNKAKDVEEHAKRQIKIKSSKNRAETTITIRIVVYSEIQLS